MITGLVVDPTGRGLDNATVILGDHITLCARDGAFRIDAVPGGDQTYKIVHRDYPVVRGTLEVDGDANYQFQMVRPRAAGAEAGSGILEAKRATESWLIAEFEPVIGVGISTDRTVILVYVRVGEGEIPILPGMPETLGGYPVRLVPVDAAVRSPDATGTETRTRQRPVCGGISAAHHETPAGTLGAVVYDRKTGEPMLLSNNHIFAQCSSDAEARAQVGDPILQPSRLDGGGPDDTVGELARWVPYRVQGKNYVDAAVAAPRSGVRVDPRVFVGDEMVAIAGARAVSRPTRVRMCGRTTGCGWGEVVDWDFATVMDYPTGESILYTDQLLISIPADAGDSGAVLLDEENYAIGLLNGTTVIDGRQYAVANKIRNVIEALDLELPNESLAKKDLLFGALVFGSLIGLLGVASCRT